MDEPAAVGLIERGGDLAHYPQRLIGRELALGLEHGAQVAPLHVAHREVELPVVLARLVDGHDVRVVERCGEPRSFRKRSRKRSSSASSGATSLSATGRSSDRSVAL